MREDVRRPYRSAALRRKKREEEDEAGTALVPLADGCDAACAFVNAEIDRAVVEGLVDSEALLAGLRDGTVGAAGLDVYFAGAPLENEICYRCLGTGAEAKPDCPRRVHGRCH